MPQPLRQTYQLKITLKHVRPPIWRRVLVPSSITLAQLHEVVQLAMGWEDAHLHHFVAGDRVYGVRDPAFPDGTLDEAKVRLRRLLTAEKQSLLYEYDFGDGWVHELVLEKIMPFRTEQLVPVCLKGRRAGPPEDCGGPLGYRNLLAVLQNPRHPGHREVSRWLGAPPDPERFDAAAVSARLREQVRL